MKREGNVVLVDSDILTAYAGAIDVSLMVIRSAAPLAMLVLFYMSIIIAGGGVFSLLWNLMLPTKLGAPEVGIQFGSGIMLMLSVLSSPLLIAIRPAPSGSALRVSICAAWILFMVAYLFTLCFPSGIS